MTAADFVHKLMITEDRALLIEADDRLMKRQIARSTADDRLMKRQIARSTADDRLMKRRIA